MFGSIVGKRIGMRMEASPLETVMDAVILLADGLMIVTALN